MDPEEEIWIVSQLMRLDEGARKFLVNCFLFLDPEQMKACRLVCKEWNAFIMDDVWKSKRNWVKEKLDHKLVHRYRMHQNRCNI